ncbi:MAG: NAD-dependent epimerase/dehydratase family protein [Bacteroidota bacterium]
MDKNDSNISLVTGGSGFIGRHVVQRLLHLGRPVKVLDLNVSEGTFPKEVEVFKGSILDQTLVANAMEGTKDVYHLAANPNLWAKDKNVFHEVNFEGTKTILEEAKKHNIHKLVYTSTETILKDYRSKSLEATTEDIELPPLKQMAGPYSHSKMLADEAVRKAAKDGLPAVVVNPTIPIGLGDYNLTPPTRMIMDFLNGKTPAYMECHMNLAPVEEVAEGHILAADKGISGHRYLLSNENLKLSEILTLLEEITGKEMPHRKVPYFLGYTTAVISEFIADHITGKAPVASKEGVRLAGGIMKFDNQKTRAALGLKARSVKEALGQAIAWLKEEGLVK